MVDRQRNDPFRLFERVFGPHRLGGFLAYEQSTYNSDLFRAYRSDFVSTRIAEFFAGNESDRVSGQPFASARQNYFCRLQYNYSDR